MVTLVHEIWEVIDDRGSVLPALGLAGPDGDGFRERLHEDAREDGLEPPRCVGTFEAGSHFEAMTIYYRRYNRGEYTADLASDREPYPEEWARRQAGEQRGL
jgi:hypothetical protein